MVLAEGTSEGLLAGDLTGWDRCKKEVPDQRGSREQGGTTLSLLQ